MDGSPPTLVNLMSFLLPSPYHVTLFSSHTTCSTAPPTSVYPFLDVTSIQLLCGLTVQSWNPSNGF